MRLTPGQWPTTSDDPPQPPATLVQQWANLPPNRPLRITEWVKKLGLVNHVPDVYLLAVVMYRLDGWSLPQSDQGYPKTSRACAGEQPRLRPAAVPFIRRAVLLTRGIPADHPLTRRFLWTR